MFRSTYDTVSAFAKLGGKLLFFLALSTEISLMALMLLVLPGLAVINLSFVLQ
jgi:hypothetical protein